jgi:phosphopantothenoylcysteine decarboxylase/phosphopantothenate--cysteine ligase
MLTGKRIVVGVGGSIAAYKAAGVVRRLVEAGATVDVVMTDAATRFVAPLTFEALSRRPVATDLFTAHEAMLHLTLSEQADLVLIAPATAHRLAACALGLADDLLNTIVVAARCPLVVVPAMDGGMWDHPAVQTHVQTLRQRGVTIMDPEEGPLASGRIGTGRFPDESAILAAVERQLASARDLSGHRVLVSAGPTQEAIDPVRYLSNRSSGKMGYAVAQAARERGAEVVLVSGPTALSKPAGVACVAVTTAEEMEKALTVKFPWATILVMAAAVADFRPRRRADDKIKKHAGAPRVDLEPTTDIVAALARQRTGQILVGFAAETNNVLQQAKDKLFQKGLDLIVGNNVSMEGGGFGSDTNAAVLVDRKGRVTELPLMSKRDMAHRIFDAVLSLQGVSKPAIPAPDRSAT